MPESFIVLALPHSTRPDDVHVSLFLAPRLTTTDPDATLRDFPTFADWESSLASGTVTLRDQDGVIESRVDPRVEAGLWGRFFDPATPVGAEPLPDWSNRRVHSFDVRNVTTLAKVLQAATVLASPTKPPSVDEHPLGAGMLRFAERFTRYDPRFPESRHNPQVRLVYDESLGTELMDDWLAKGGPDGGPKAGPVAGADLVARAAYELHLARRFYERPESLEQQEYSERPDPRFAAGAVARAQGRVPRAGHRARRPPGAAAPAGAGDRPGGRRRRAARLGPGGCRAWSRSTGPPASGPECAAGAPPTARS